MTVSNYPTNIENKIDFVVIREDLRARCASGLGRERVDEMCFHTDYATVSHLLAMTHQMYMALSDASLSFPRGDIHDMRESISRIRVEGLFLDETELDALRHSLSYAYDLETFFLQLDEQLYPLLRTLPAFEDVEGSLHTMVRTIDNVLDKYGRLADNASPELARIRRELNSLQGSVGRTLASILRQAKAAGFVEGDVTPTLREGRLVIPVSPAYKRKIGGIVHDESATGKTVIIEPQQVVEANNHIRELESEERRERIRILQTITEVLRPQVALIMRSQEMLADVDFLCLPSDVPLLPDERYDTCQVDDYSCNCCWCCASGISCNRLLQGKIEGTCVSAQYVCLSRPPSYMLRFVSRCDGQIRFYGMLL